MFEIQQKLGSMAIQPMLNFSLAATKCHPLSFSVAPKHWPASRLELCASKKEKLGVVVKPMERARIVLKVIRMQKTIGIGLDQLVPGTGTFPLTPYYFWRKENALHHLQLLLQTKPWIPHSHMDILLDQASHILDSWPDAG